MSKENKLGISERDMDALLIAGNDSGMDYSSPGEASVRGDHWDEIVCGEPMTIQEELYSRGYTFYVCYSVYGLVVSYVCEDGDYGLSKRLTDAQMFECRNEPLEQRLEEDLPGKWSVNHIIYYKCKRCLSVGNFRSGVDENGESVVSCEMCAYMWVE